MGLAHKSPGAHKGPGRPTRAGPTRAQVGEVIWSPHTAGMLNPGVQLQAYIYNIDIYIYIKYMFMYVHVHIHVYIYNIY